MTVSRASIFDGTASSSVRVILLFVVLFLPWLTAHQVSLDAGIVVSGALITTIALVFTLVMTWKGIFSRSNASDHGFDAPLILDDPAPTGPENQAEPTATDIADREDDRPQQIEMRPEGHALTGTNDISTTIDPSSGIVTIDMAGETTRIHAANVRDLTLTWGSEAYGFDPHASNPLDGLDDLVKSAVRAVRRRPLSLRIEAEDISFSVTVFDKSSPSVGHENLSRAMTNYLLAIFARMPK